MLTWALVTLANKRDDFPYEVLLASIMGDVVIIMLGLTIFVE